MLIRHTGATAGIVEYLETGKKSGREYSRTELDERLVLTGNIRELEQVLNQLETHIKTTEKDLSADRYDHFTLSFKEEYIDEITLRNIDKEFNRFITAAFGDEFYYYSEAHLPKIKQLHDFNGENYERFPHIHIVIPKYNMYLDKKENPLGWHNRIIPCIDAFQDYINTKYNLANPKDNRRSISIGKEGVLDRYHPFHSFQNRQQVKNEVFNLIRTNRSIKSVDDLAQALEPYGKVKVRDSEKFGQKYINFLPKDYTGKKAINLKDAVFLDDYLQNRTLAATNQFAQQDYTPKLEQWYKKTALEQRFIMPLSETRRAAYFAHDEAYQDKVLQGQVAIHRKLLQEIEYTPSEPTGERKLVLAKHFRQPEHFAQFEHFADIEHFADMPHFTDLTQNTEYNNERNPRNQQVGRANREQFDIRRTEQSEPDYQSRQSMPDLSGGSSNTRRNRRNTDDRTNLLHGNARNDLDNQQTVQNESVFQLRTARYLTPTTGEKYAQEVLQRRKTSEWTDKINAVDCRVLLRLLSHKYGLNEERFNIEPTKQGYDRIVVGNRRISASDFLRQYMNLNWQESRAMIEYALQENSIRLPESSQSIFLKARFNREEQAEYVEQQELREQYKIEKQAILNRYRFKENPKATKAQNTVMRKLATQQRNYQLQALRDKYQPLWRSKQKPHERYLEWLHKQAISGNLNALNELQRIYPHYEDRQEKETQDLLLQSLYNQPLPQKHFPPDLGLSLRILKNGTIEYCDNQGKTLITNAYHSITVKDKTVENIEKALRLAEMKFGKNGFEIITANRNDLKNIQAAVDKTQIAVSVKEKTSKVVIERGR